MMHCENTGRMGWRNSFIDNPSLHHPPSHGGFSYQCFIFWDFHQRPSSTHFACLCTTFFLLGSWNIIKNVFREGYETTMTDSERHFARSRNSPPLKLHSHFQHAIIKFGAKCDPGVTHHDRGGGCVINGAPYSRSVLGETFSSVHRDGPLMTAGTWGPHLTSLDFISKPQGYVVKQKLFLEWTGSPDCRQLEGSNESFIFMFIWASPPWVFSPLLSILMGKNEYSLIIGGFNTRVL